jgi:sphingomyelin phosphodiesterase
LPFCTAPNILKAVDFANTHLADKPENFANNDALDSLYPGVSGGDQYNILHFTDLFIDYNY